MEKILQNGRIDISTAWCKSGTVRSASARYGNRACRNGRVVVIDHCGHELYARLKTGCCGVLAIGDDTTAVCGHICAHRGIPVLGIIDGDRDTCLPSVYAPGSIVILALRERDDDLGKEVAGMLDGRPVVWEGWCDHVLARLADRVRIVIDTRESQ